MFSVDKTKWIENSRYVRVHVPPLAPLAGPVSAAIAAVSAPGGAGFGAVSVLPPRADTIIGLAAGEYYVVAVDDITQEASRDPDVLEQMVRAATRVMLSEGVAAQATVRRVSLGR